MAGKEFVTRRSGEREKRLSKGLRQHQLAAEVLQARVQLAGWEACEAAGSDPWAAQEAALRATEWSVPPPVLPAIGAAAQPLAAASALTAASMVAGAAAGAAGEQPRSAGRVAAWVEAAAAAAAGVPAPVGPDEGAHLPLPVLVPQTQLQYLAVRKSATLHPPSGSLPRTNAAAAPAKSLEVQAAAATHPQPETASMRDAPALHVQQLQQQQQRMGSQRAGPKSGCSSVARTSSSSSSGGDGGIISPGRCCNPLAALARLLRF